METTSITTAGVEFRQSDDGRNITGAIVHYGAVARTRRGRETIAAGAFLGLRDPGFPVSLEHGLGPAQRLTTYGEGLLSFDDSPTALRATMRVPEGDLGTAAIEGVQSGKLTGWSSEFVPFIESVESGVNTIYRAYAVGLGLVGKPAYPGSLVELRQGHNLLISGPAGAGKSQLARELSADDGAEVIELQEIYARILGIERDPETGRYPERQPGDAWALREAETQRNAAIAAAVAENRPAIATNSSGNPARRQTMLNRLGASAVEEVLDPGEEEVVRRLSGRGGLSRQCRNAVDRWYRWERFTRPYYRSKGLAWL